MHLSDYLDKDLILFLKESDKKSVLHYMIQEAGKTDKVLEEKKFRDAIEAREAIMSTGIGLGVAVPHAKTKTIPEFFIVLAVLEDPIDWDSLDKQPVRIVFLIGGPEDRQTDYLKILSKIVLQIKNEERREKLLKAKKAEEVLALFEQL